MSDHDDNQSFGNAVFGIPEARIEELNNVVQEEIKRLFNDQNKKNGGVLWHELYMATVPLIAQTRNEELYCASLFGAIRYNQNAQKAMGGDIKAALMMALIGKSPSGSRD